MTLDDVQHTDGQAYARKVQLMEEELIKAGWSPLTKHEKSPVWRHPSGQLYPGVEYAWRIMKGEEWVEKPHR